MTSPLPHSPPPPTPPTRTPSQSAQPAEGDGLATARRLPRLEDFPEAGPNALATFQQRGFARLADELVVTVPFLWLLSTFGLAAADDTGDLSNPTSRLLFLLTAGAFSLQVIYEVIVVAVWGQTVGKWMTGIRVARYSDGGKPTWAQSALRCLVWAAPGAAGLALLRVSLAGALPVFLSAWRGPLRRAWHDEAGGTIVVRTR